MCQTKCICPKNCAGCLNDQPKPHKHAAVIKAWADGKQIQVRPEMSGRYSSPWQDIGIHEQPIWVIELEYRVKPEPKPNRTFQALFVLNEQGTPSFRCCTETDTANGLDRNLTIVFDGETNKLISAKAI